MTIDKSQPREHAPLAAPLLHHGRIKCGECGKIIASCRCPDCTTASLFVTCQECALKAGYHNAK